MRSAALRPTLRELLHTYNTDKDRVHSYGTVYEDLLSPIRDMATSVLEIGVLNGDSLRVWRDFFPNAQITGIDINEACKVDELRISTHIGEQSNTKLLFNVGYKYGPFDLIVDDGSHTPSDQLTSLLYLWGFVKPTGFYVIEDIQDEQYLQPFLFLGAKVHDLRYTRPSAPPDDILVVLQRNNMNYGFKCPEEGCDARAYLNILQPMSSRPRCPRHQTHYVPDIKWPPSTKIEEEIISPLQAEELLETAFPSSFEGVDPLLVENYAELMTKGKWVFITREMGGEHYPIYFRDDKVLLGIQRLQACVRSGVPMDTVTVRTYGYH